MKTLKDGRTVEVDLMTDDSGHHQQRSQKRKFFAHDSELLNFFSVGTD
jgi:hypothetical protein